MTDQTIDTSRPVIMTRAVLVNGHSLDRGEAISVVDEESDGRAELTPAQVTQLLGAGIVVYLDRSVATPVETPEQYAARATEVDDLGHGTFLIRAPWLGEGEVVDEDKLTERRQEVVDEGAKAHRELIDEFGPDTAATLVTGLDGFLADDKGNGNYEITGPGLDEPLKVRGRQNALDKLAELRAAAAAKSTEEQGTAPPPPDGPGATDAVPPPPPGASSVTAPPISDAAPTAQTTTE